MTTLEEKIEKAILMHNELQESNDKLEEAKRTVMLKAGTLDDFLKDIAKSELGFPDAKEMTVSLPEIMKRCYLKGRP